MSDQGADSIEQRDKESRLRSILKAFSWRFIATGTTFTVTYFVVLIGASQVHESLAGIVDRSRLGAGCFEVPFKVCATS